MNGVNAGMTHVGDVVTVLYDNENVEVYTVEADRVEPVSSRAVRVWVNAELRVDLSEVPLDKSREYSLKVQAMIEKKQGRE